MGKGIRFSFWGLIGIGVGGGEGKGGRFSRGREGCCK